MFSQRNDEVLKLRINMKEKRFDKYFSVISYIVAVGFIAWYFYCGIALYSPFLRAGLLLAGCVFMFLGTYTGAKHKDTEAAKKRMKVTFSLMFLLYVFMLVTFLFFDGYFGRNSVGADEGWTKESLSEYLQTSANFVPFKSTGSLIYGYCKGWISFAKPLLNIGGNLVAFMPFALFLPLLFKKQRKAVPFLISITSMVIFVEVTQIVLRCGVCDVDDLILNIGGAGLMMFVLHIKPVRKLLNKLTFGLF